MMRDFKKLLETDIKLLLYDVAKEDLICSQVLNLYTQGYNIKSICNKLNISRFRVKKKLDKGLRIIKDILLEEDTNVY